MRERIEINPLRAFDADDEGTRGVMTSAPTIVERLEGDDAEHFDEVRALLDAAGVAYEIDPTLVRGLDYYTRTIFSFVCDRLGAQSEVGGGGRYDGLIEQLGGPPTPAVGWAAGIERILLALDEPEAGPGRDVFLAVADPGQRAARADPGGRAAPRRPLRRGRPGRARPQGPAQARRPDRRPPRADPRGGRQRRSCATWRAASSARSTRRAGRGDRGRAIVSEAPALRANGCRDTWCGQVLGDRVDSEARVAGWVHRRRDHGGLIFIDLRDRTGIVQLVFHPDASGEAFELAHKLRAEDVLSAAGTVVRRSAETVNPELPTGEVELAVTAAELLADAETPPFQIEGFSGEVGEDARLRHRYLDLRREPMREALVLRHRVTAAMREFLDGEGFLDDRDAGPDPLDPGGRARLPRPQPPPAGLLLRAAPVAAAVQAAADGRRLRALLPDRPLLPRRGPARRPPAGLHPARHRDVVRRRRRRDRGQRAPAGARLRAGRRPGDLRCRSSGWPTTRRWTASAPTGRTCASASSWST